MRDAEAVKPSCLGIDDSLPGAAQYAVKVGSLHEYREFLVRLGKTGEAIIIGQQLKLAAAVADVPIEVWLLLSCGRQPRTGRLPGIYRSLSLLRSDRLMVRADSTARSSTMPPL